LSTTNPTCCLDANPGRRGWKPATNRLSYGTANVSIYMIQSTESRDVCPSDSVLHHAGHTVPANGKHATSRKVAGSILDDIIGFLNWPNPSSRTMAPGVDSASNRNEYQESSWG
jgi:hypothetical protein